MNPSRMAGPHTPNPAQEPEHTPERSSLYERPNKMELHLKPEQAAVLSRALREQAAAARRLAFSLETLWQQLNNQLEEP